MELWDFVVTNVIAIWFAGVLIALAHDVYASRYRNQKGLSDGRILLSWITVFRQFYQDFFGQKVFPSHDEKLLPQAIKTKSLATKFFHTRKEDVDGIAINLIDKNFRRWFLGMYMEEDAAHAFRAERIGNYMQAQSIINLFGGEALVVMLLEDLEYVMLSDAFFVKETGVRNVVFIRDDAKKLRAISLIWVTEGWRIFAHALDEDKLLFDIDSNIVFPIREG